MTDTKQPMNHKEGKNNKNYPHQVEETGMLPRKETKLTKK